MSGISHSVLCQGVYFFFHYEWVSIATLFTVVFLATNLFLGCQAPIP